MMEIPDLKISYFHKLPTSEGFSDSLQSVWNKAKHDQLHLLFGKWHCMQTTSLEG